MKKPTILDLFCCAGGAAKGYHLAGFDVIGVDIEFQSDYPFAFIQMNAMNLSPTTLSSFDAIHASPPCQGYSAMRNAPGTKGAPLLIDAVRNLLRLSGKPYIIENVEGARWALHEPITLCGSMFGLGSEGHQLRRHRLFECNFPVVQPSCRHSDAPVIGIYGGHARRRSAKFGGRQTRDTWTHGHKYAMSEAMGINWTTCNAMSEAIPPAYTEYLGKQLMNCMQRDTILSQQQFNVTNGNLHHGTCPQDR